MSTSAAHSIFYRSLFVDLDALIRRWYSIESESANHFATLANVAGRIEGLKNVEDLGILREFDGLPQQMKSIQFSGMEATMETLRKA